MWCQEVLPEDLDQFTGELWERVRGQVRRALAERTGLLLLGNHPDLERIEWLWLWDGAPDIEQRLKAFETGLSAMRPHKPARDLKASDLAALARRAGVTKRGT